jgi:hypothetical protein
VLWSYSHRNLPSALLEESWEGKTRRDSVACERLHDSSQTRAPLVVSLIELPPGFSLGGQNADAVESIDSRGKRQCRRQGWYAGSTIQRILADLKPEAAYFYADDSGQRAGSIVFDLKDPSQIPAVAEPWFLAFNATLSFRPVMNPQDLANAVPAIAAAVQNYGK